MNFDEEKNAFFRWIPFSCFCKRRLAWDAAMILVERESWNWLYLYRYLREKLRIKTDSFVAFLWIDLEKVLSDCWMRPSRESFDSMRAVLFQVVRWRLLGCHVSETDLASGQVDRFIVLYHSVVDAVLWVLLVWVHLVRFVGSTARESKVVIGFVDYNC